MLIYPIVDSFISIKCMEFIAKTSIKQTKQYKLHVQKQKSNIILHTDASCLEMSRGIYITLSFSQPLSVDNDTCFKCSDRSYI